jgi:uncharacterized membrane protein
MWLMVRLERLVVRHQSVIALSIGTAYFVLYAILSVLRHRSYHSLGFDLGLFDQVLWNTIHGRPLESTMSQALPTPHSLLGDHFSPLLLLLAPIYAAYPHAETLLVIQTLALTLGAWPVYLLAKLKLPGAYALPWVIAYFLFLPVAFINLFDFHEVALAVLPIGFALYFLERGQRTWFVVSLLVTFLIKEEMALIGIGFGAYALLGKRDWKLGLAVMAGSFVAFVAIIQLVIPYFGSGRSYPYISERYGQVGGSPLGILRTLATDPLRIVRALLQPKKVYFLIGIFGPVVGLSWLAGWASLLLLPTLGYLLLSSYELQYSLATQYSAPLIPLVLGTAILGMARLRGSAQKRATMAVIASSLVFSWAFGDLPFSRKFDFTQFQTAPSYAGFVTEVDAIPSDASVSAENGFPSHLSERRYIYDFGREGTQNAQWVVLDYAGANHNMERFLAQVAEVESEGYTEVASADGLALFRKP